MKEVAFCGRKSSTKRKSQHQEEIQQSKSLLEAPYMIFIVSMTSWKRAYVLL